jgi:hypothetical protein
MAIASRHAPAYDQHQPRPHITYNADNTVDGQFQITICS